MTLTCPHCGATNQPGGLFCVSCGKALPTDGNGPRVVDTLSGQATSAIGKQAQEGELKKLSKQAFGALLAVAILTTLGAILIGLLGATLLSKTNPGEQIDSAVVIATVVISSLLALAFYGLAFWARKNPLPPAIIGLTIYVSVNLLDAVMAPENLIKGILIKIIIVAVLAKAIQAGVKHRQLTKGRASA